MLNSFKKMGIGILGLTANHDSLVFYVSSEGAEKMFERLHDIVVRNEETLAIAQRLDLALLRISGSALPTIKLGDSSTVHEGQMLAFTGYPIGMVLGLHPVTHRAMVSSITPVVMPGLNSRQLDVKMINRLRSSPYDVFQLDGTAYPGNSGSPLYDPNTGLVYGVVNMVFVKGTKETALAQPSGITYAIPGKYIHDLMRQEQLIK